jgi:hypothetical protein
MIALIKSLHQGVGGRFQPSHLEPCYLSEVSPALCHPDVLSMGHQVGHDQSVTLELHRSFLSNKYWLLPNVVTPDVCAWVKQWHSLLSA